MGEGLVSSISLKFEYFCISHSNLDNCFLDIYWKNMVLYEKVVLLCLTRVQTVIVFWVICLVSDIPFRHPHTYYIWAPKTLMLVLMHMNKCENKEKSWLSCLITKNIEARIMLFILCESLKPQLLCKIGKSHLISRGSAEDNTIS